MPATTTGATAHPSPVRTSAPQRVLCSLNAQEMECFFPGIQWQENLSGGHEWLLFQGESDAAWRELIEDFRPNALISCWSTKGIDPEWSRSADCSLKYVCHVVGSVRHVVPRQFLERGGLVTNWGGAPSAQVAEHALLLALSALRNAASWWPYIESGNREGIHQAAALRTRTLIGKRVGIHGFGRIARALIKFLEPFNVSICCYSEGVPPAAIAASGATPTPDLPALFSESDVLFECEALTPLTKGSVTEKDLSALPRDAIFVNVGRGSVVDEEALIQLAGEGRIRIALDVVSQEPLHPDTGFRQVKGAILSPHIGGPTFEKFPECGELAMNKLHQFLNGEPVPGLMTLAEYDRST